MPTNPDGSISIRTLGDFIDAGYGYSVYCDAEINGTRCGHQAKLDLEKLAERLGRDHSALAGDLSKKLRCTVCGRQKMSFNITTSVGWDGSGGHSNHS